MEGGDHMSVEESEMIMQLLGAHYFQDFNSDFSSCFSSSHYYYNNWPQKDNSIGLNHKMIDEERINLTPIKRKFETENDDKQDSCTNIPQKKARACITTNACKEHEKHFSSSSLSENDSIDKSGASNSKGKNGNQSLYARKRREKINQRLRKLQELIPSGTKVDISTMLAEAFQYIKFLQLQIKLLSSDEMWMYAPLAFNGINTGFDMSIIPEAQDSRFNM